MADTSLNENRIGLLIWQTSNVWQSKIRKQLINSKLSFNEYLILETIYKLSKSIANISQVDVAKHCFVDKSVVSAKLTQLQNKKLINKMTPNDNRSNKLVEKKTNKNDVLNIIGEPHVKSIQNDDVWIYLERSLTKGKYHKLGKHVVKANNTLILTFDRFGILESKKFYSKEDIQKIKFTEKRTENKLSKESFVSSFLSSLRNKMYGNRKN